MKARLNRKSSAGRIRNATISAGLTALQATLGIAPLQEVYAAHQAPSSVTAALASAGQTIALRAPNGHARQLVQNVSRYATTQATRIIAVARAGATAVAAILGSASLTVQQNAF